jgi:hypothetical protein
MAYAPTRSANRELSLGMVEGAYKQVNRDRGGVVEPGTSIERLDLDHKYYAVVEAPSFKTPDGPSMVSPYHVTTECPCCGGMH